jgi:hypothetical protein
MKWEGREVAWRPFEKVLCEGLARYVQKRMEHAWVRAPQLILKHSSTKPWRIQEQQALFRCVVAYGSCHQMCLRRSALQQIASLSVVAMYYYF